MEKKSVHLTKPEWEAASVSDQKVPGDSRREIARQRNERRKVEPRPERFPESGAIYREQDFAKMASILGVEPTSLIPHRERMELSAALYLRSPSWRTESAKAELEQVAGACWKILKLFDIHDTIAAEDGPGHRAAPVVRALSAACDEERLRQAVLVVAQLADAATVAEGFQLAPKDGDEAPVALALRGVFAGNSPDLAQDDFVSGLMSIYFCITGRPPTVDNRATSGPEGGGASPSSSPQWNQSLG
jgi:hypothetical protein